MSLTFDEASHTYALDGRPIPGVTSLLAPMVDFSFVKPEALERARLEGVAMHKLVELSVKDDLDVASLPDWLLPRLTAWHKFVDDTGFECLGSEQRVCDPKAGYAGTLDLVGKVRLTRSKHKGIAIIDIKRSFAGGPLIGVQTAAYLNAWNLGRAAADRATLRFALRLDANGQYRLEPFVDAGDLGVFLSLLTVQKFKARHGL